MKSQVGGFVENAPSPELAAWVTSTSRTSDAYLTQIARANGLKPRTFDTGSAIRPSK